MSATEWGWILCGVFLAGFFVGIWATTRALKQVLRGQR